MKVSDKPVEFTHFEGMNNVARELVANCPQIVLNMDTTIDGRLVKRVGRTIFKALQDAHSLFSDGEDFFLAGKGASVQEAFYRLSGSGTLTELCQIMGKGNPLSYVAANNLLYVSSKAWTGVYQYTTKTMRAWGSAYGNDLAILDQYDESEILQTVGVRGPEPMECIALFAGRIWGIVGTRLVYSDPLALEWFRDSNFIPFTHAPVLIGVVGSGLYVASEDHTWFLMGTSPSTMQVSRVGNGAVPGTMQYATWKEIGADLPTWVSPDGIVCGTKDGILVNLTQNKIRYDTAGRGAGLFRLFQGEPQYLASFPMPDQAKLGDSVTADVVRRGQFI